MAFKVLSAEFMHETNTFNTRRTNLKEFESRFCFFGTDAIRERGSKNQNTELAGFCEVAGEENWQMVHVLSASAEPSGLVSIECFEYFVGAILAGIVEEQSKGTPLNGILLGLHGSMSAVGFEDADGELLSRLRELVGPNVPIAVTLDLHANCSAKMADMADIIVSYKTYPHVDMFQTGKHAAEILHSAMNRTIKPRTIRKHVPRLLEEVNGGRTDVGPMVRRVELIREYEKSGVGGVLAVSINAGFGNCDIQKVGPTVLVTYDVSHDEDSRRSAHEAFAESICDDMWKARFELINSFMTVDEAALIAKLFSDDVAAAATTTKAPLVIADYADNPGGGAYGDSTNLLRALLEANVSHAAFGPMVDPEAASELVAVWLQSQRGARTQPQSQVETNSDSALQSHPVSEITAHSDANATIVSIRVGGKTDSRFGGEPLLLSGELVYASELGVYCGEGPMISGLRLSYGPTAVLRVGEEFEVLIVSSPAQMLDLQQFRAFGIEPTTKRVVALKSMQHFRAAFEPIAAKVIVCDSGALCTPDLSKLPYENVPRPIFPLDSI